MSPSSYGNLKLIFRNDHFHRAVRLIDQYPDNLRRGKGIAGKSRHVFFPRDDVDLLPLQLFHNLLNPGSPKSHAGTNGIDILISRFYCNLCPGTRFTGDGRTGHDPFIHFGDLELEKFENQPGIGAAQYNFGSPLSFQDIFDICPDSISLAISLPFYLFPGWHDRLGPPEVYDHQIPLKSVDNGVHEVSLLPDILVVDHLTLRLLHPLENNLFRCLRSDPSQLLGSDPEPDMIAQLGVGIIFEGIVDEYLVFFILYFFNHLTILYDFELSRILVKEGFHLFLLAKFFPRGIFEGLLYGFDDHFLPYSLLFP